MNEIQFDHEVISSLLMMMAALIGVLIAIAFRERKDKPKEIKRDFTTTSWYRKAFPDEGDYADKLLRHAPLGRTPTHAELDKIWDHIFCAGHGWVPPSQRQENPHE
jgi:hypothetical protein